MKEIKKKYSIKRHKSIQILEKINTVINLELEMKKMIQNSKAEKKE